MNGTIISTSKNKSHLEVSIRGRTLHLKLRTKARGEVDDIYTDREGATYFVNAGQIELLADAKGG